MHFCGLFLFFLQGMLINMKRIYLDANGASPALDHAKNKIIETINMFGNPSSSHEHGRVLRAMIDEARRHVAQAINVHEKDFFFTSGASESNRLFVDALKEMAKGLSAPFKVLMSPFEHSSLLKPVIEASGQGLFALKILELDDEGSLRIDAEEIKNADVLIVCQAHNETGILPDIEAILRECKTSTLVMSDISQGFARLDPESVRIDVMTCSAQKMGGFPGVGGIVFRGQGKKLKPPWQGGGQERGFRPGTESSLLIFAFGEAALYVESLRKQHRELGSLRDYFEEHLAAIAEIKIIGKNLKRLPNTSAVCFLHENPDALRIACDRAGLSVGFGAACSGLAPEGSFALKALGLNLAQEKATVRFSLPVTTTIGDIDETLERLAAHVLTNKTN